MSASSDVEADLLTSAAEAAGAGPGAGPDDSGTSAGPADSGPDAGLAGEPAGPPPDPPAAPTEQTGQAERSEQAERAERAAWADRIGELADAVAEISRLRSRDADLIARLHDDVTRLRTGEIATALNPLVTGMIKLHDQMVSLGALNDQASPVGMLHTQLLQTLELTCAVKPFSPAAGEQFDASRHTGTRRIAPADPAVDGTIAATIKAGFVRDDGSVVRVAEVEVHRLAG